jgi:hypothetical protein
MALGGAANQQPVDPSLCLAADLPACRTCHVSWASCPASMLPRSSVTNRCLPACAPACRPAGSVTRDGRAVQQARVTAAAAGRVPGASWGAAAGGSRPAGAGGAG